MKKNSEKIVIIGAGPSGLMASHVFGKYGKLPVVYESNKIGGDFLSGGLKYIRLTDNIESLFAELGILFSKYTINGGIMLKGEVLPYPMCFQSMSRENVLLIQEKHYLKTRKVKLCSFGRHSMNDPSERSKRAVRCDIGELINVLHERAFVNRDEVIQINSKNRVLNMKSGKSVYYDLLIVTVPLWVVKEISDFYVPEANAANLNILEIEPVKDPYRRWDYVYTPYTPYDAVHRFSSNDTGYGVEANGDYETQKDNIFGDIDFIFPGGFNLKKTIKGVKGHLVDPAGLNAEFWPDGIIPLGRFAQWNPRATIDVVLDRIHWIAKARKWKKKTY